jgi:hypothetical protein
MGDFAEGWKMALVISCGRARLRDDIIGGLMMSGHPMCRNGGNESATASSCQ